MKSVINHVAILVKSIESVLEKNLFPSNLIDEIEEFPYEGTRELYIGLDKRMDLVLIKPL